MMNSIAPGFVFAACFIASVLSQSQTAYELPADAEAILEAPLSTSFTCDGQPYGYYADVDNNCQVFHVCLPLEDEFGQITETAQYSFICGNATVFDQNTLTCNYPENSIPCPDSPSLYGAVEFGKVPPSSA